MQIEERGKVNFNKKSIGNLHKIAPLILVVFIENAFKHSQASQADNIEMYIKIELNGDRLTFACRNNYRPIQADGELNKGIGLKNVRKRLELLYPDAHELKISESGTIFEVKLSMELQKLTDQ